MNMDVRDRLFLGPIDKYKKHARYPWKLFLGLTLAVLTSMNVIVIVSEFTNYSYSQMTVFNNLFLNRDASGSDTSLTNTFNLFNIASLMDYIDKTVKTYSTINSFTFDSYKYKDEGENVNTPEPIKMYVEYLNNNAVNEEGYYYEYPITIDNAGPLTLTNAKEFLEKISFFYLQFTLYHELPPDSEFTATCFRWDLQQLFSYRMHGVITVTLNPTIRVCPNSMQRYYSRYTWFNIVVMVCAIIAFILSLNSIRRRLKLLAHIRGLDDQSIGQMWTHLTLSDKLKFVSVWTVASFVSNILVIFSCITFFFVSRVSMDIYFRAVGFGCFFAWINVLKYLEWSPNSYAVINTLKRSFATLWRYVLGILPIFMGFVFLAMTLFWKSGSYNDTTQAMMTSFALLNGDTVYGFFSGNVGVNFLGGYLYMFIFLVLFICAIHNLFISIIGEGFDSLKSNPIRRGDELEEPGSPRQKTDAESKRAISKKKSKVRFRRLMNKQTVIADSSTSIAVSEMNDLLRQIREKMDRLKELVMPQEGVVVDHDRLKEKLRILVEENFTGTLTTIEQLTRDI